ALKSSVISFRVIRFFFFFSSRRRHTRSLRDWSSDVCSSDLLRAGRGALRLGQATPDVEDDDGEHRAQREGDAPAPFVQRRLGHEIGRASCRERGWVSGGGEVCERKKEKEGRYITALS